MERYKLATLKARQTSNTAELTVNVYEWDDEGGSVLHFDVKRTLDGGALSTGAKYARFDTLDAAIVFAAEEISGRLSGNF